MGTYDQKSITMDDKTGKKEICGHYNISTPQKLKTITLFVDLGITAGNLNRKI